MNVELLNSQSPRGFELSGDFEMFIYDTDVEQRAFMIGTLGVAAPQKLVRLVQRAMPLRAPVSL